MRFEILTDSSAASGIVHHLGCGRVKHLEARQLWIQGHVESKEVKVCKVSREVNFSDVFTHNWSSVDGYLHLHGVGISWDS